MNMISRGLTTIYEQLLRKNCRKSLASTITNEEKEKRQKEMMARGLPKKKPISGVKQIVLVASGKGGVGKSTVAVNIAVALKAVYPQMEIGLLDADVFGPTVPLMMNLNESPLLTKDSLMKPLLNHGVKCMSMGFLVGDRNASVVWRGLMVMNALERLLRGTAWAPLDILVVDTPPGTGDTHLSLAQSVPVSGVVLVTTPQLAALQVTQRGSAMFKKVGIPVMGLVHNMAWIQCPSCHSQVHIFGKGSRVQQLASAIGTEVLAEIPMDSVGAELTEAGKPVVIAQTESLSAVAFRSIAAKLKAFLEKNSISPSS